MKALFRKLIFVIASLLIPVLPAEVGNATPPVFKTQIDKTPAVANIVLQTGSEGSRRRRLMSKVSQPQGIAIDISTGRLYWTDTGTHKIYSAHIDGTGQETVVEWTPNPRGIAVDKGRIYWTDSGNHQIRRYNLDGSGHQVLVKWAPNPQEIAVDDAGGKIYWTDSGTHQIQRANLNGSGSETLVKWAYDPRGIAVDSAGGKIYWTDSRTRQIYRANLDGSQLEVLIASTDLKVHEKISSQF